MCSWRWSLNGYFLPPDKIEIEIEMLSEYQLKIADFHHISIGNVFDNGNFFDKEKNMWFVMKTRNFTLD